MDNYFFNNGIIIIIIIIIVWYKFRNYFFRLSTLENYKASLFSVKYALFFLYKSVFLFVHYKTILMNFLFL
jgi:hypothetical protein